MESFQKNRPDLESRCTYIVNGDNAKCPHNLNIRQKSIKQKIYPNILSLIGDTPLVRINRIGKEAGIKCDLYRIGLRMVEEAEKDGTLKPGDTVIEPTSGNTGIGLALACAVKGYRCIIVMPEKMSKEKVDVLRALGAEIIRTPNSATFDSPESHIGVAHMLKMKIPNSHILDQYRNPYNPIAHYDTTAEEILEACNGKVDMIVAGAGTGGTLTGLSRKLKEKCPNCIVVGVDPDGSILAVPETLNKTGISFYEVEGIGYDFVPTVLDRSLIDRWYKSGDKLSLKLSRKLIKEEGMLCGASSGSAMSCALQACKDFGLKEGQNCVIILPDSVRNYMTKFLSDEWMFDRDFLDLKDSSNAEWWNALPVSRLKIREPVTVSTDTSIKTVLDIMHEKGFDQVPAIGEDGSFKGMATMVSIMAKMSCGSVHAQDLVVKVITDKFRTVRLDDPLSKLSRILEVHNYAVIKFAHEQYDEKLTSKTKPVVFGIISSIDLLDFIIKNKPVENGVGGGGATNGHTKDNGINENMKSVINKGTEALS
ncbi:unnamed protein product [Didymodactylos carnosus]|uniref:Cystathionine beta-synthase n=1 Tax=Didymodactylos carnosus TaxID=1234261 RepID=A0A813PK80_9BILA|nr:unnamed protein product [Didymodactylos carnosus]CAF3531447.1 unnamed protein product [Didymodactylos carnosus]